MKAAVRYYTRSGNTQKLADAVAAVIGVRAETTDVPVTEPVDVLLLASSVYATGVDEHVKEFISTLDKAMVKRIVNLSTAALLPSTYSQVQKLLLEKGIPLDTREYHCRGQFAFMHRGKPDAEDLKRAEDFAKGIIKG